MAGKAKSEASQSSEEALKMLGEIRGQLEDLTRQLEAQAQKSAVALSAQAERIGALDRRAAGQDERIEQLETQGRALKTEAKKVALALAAQAERIDALDRGAAGHGKRLEALERALEAHTSDGSSAGSFFVNYRLPAGSVPAIVESVRGDGTLDLTWFRDGVPTGIQRVVLASDSQAALLGQAFRR